MTSNLEAPVFSEEQRRQAAANMEERIRVETARAAAANDAGGVKFEASAGGDDTAADLADAQQVHRGDAPAAGLAAGKKRAPPTNERGNAPGRKRAKSDAPSRGSDRVSLVPLGDELASSGDAGHAGAAATLAEIMTMNFYDVLGAQPGATNAEIRRVFRAAALKYHPDKGGDPQIYLYLSKVRDILLNKTKREQYDFHGRAPFAEAFARNPTGGTAEGGVDALPGQRVLFAPVSYMLEKMAGDEAWATQQWGRDGSGYRFDVLAAVVLKRVKAAGPPTRADARATRDVYRLGRGATDLGIWESRLVSGRPAEGGGPSSLQQEIEAKVPHTLAGMSAAQMKSTFRAVVLFGCVEFDLVSSWMFCAKELAATLGLVTPKLQRVAVDGLTPEGRPLHAAVRKRLAEAACVTEKDLKGALQRLIGGGRWPAQMHLQEKGGRFTDDLAQLDVELEEVCARNFQNATSRQRAALADKPRPDRSFLAHTLMELERAKVDQMERIAERHGARLVGLLGDATIHAPGSLEALRRAQRDLADAGITTSLKPLAGDSPEHLVKFFARQGG